MAFVDGLTYKILVDNKVIESAYKHIDVKSVATKVAPENEESASEKPKKLSARKVRNIADITRNKKRK